MTGALIDRLQPATATVATQAGALAWERLRSDESDAARRLRDFFAEHEPAGRLADGIFAASPYLTDLILRDPEEALAAFRESPEAHAESLIAEAAAAAHLADETSF